MYIAKYLPVEKAWKDGCTIIDRKGNAREWEELSCCTDVDEFKKSHRVAELFIVAYEFNEIRVVGRPSATAMRWVKSGMEFKEFNVLETGLTCVYMEKNEYLESGKGIKIPLLSVKCEVCGK